LATKKVVAAKLYQAIGTVNSNSSPSPSPLSKQYNQSPDIQDGKTFGLNLNPALNGGSRGKLLTNRSDGAEPNPKISILDPSNEAQSQPNVIGKRAGFSL
jgi:hypothetical protein